MPLIEFKSYKFQPDASNESISRSGDGWKLCGFFQDSSLRSTFSLPLEMTCPSQDALDDLIATKCLDEFSKNGRAEPSDASAGSAVATMASRFSLAIEAKVVLTFGTGEALSAIVENLVIKSCRLQELSVCFDTELTIRVRSEAGRIDPNSVVKISLEVGSVLTEELPAQTQAEAAVAGLKALNLGGLPEIGLESQQQRIRVARLHPIDLVVSLAFAMRIYAKSIPSHTMGQTYVSLTISHSNMHEEILALSNIALHPGHSVVRPTEPGHRQQVTDMSRHVKWMYATGCAPTLPLTLKPHETFSTCLVVYATGDKLTRAFSSPISVTALVGVSERNNLFRSVVAACDIQWTTCRAAVEPADAFQVDLRVVDTDSIVVGSLLTVEMKLVNLSSEPRQVMVLVDSSRESGVANEKTGNAKAAAISSKGGHKFGVWGLLADGASSDSSVEIDDKLLTVDVALLVGDVNAGASTTVRLRFVPLKEGAICLPHFKIIDRRKGKWYKAVHNLELVAQAAAVSL